MPVRLLIAVLAAGLYALHQDVWFWRTARPLVFGFLPVGLAYHALFCLAAAALMWTLTRLAWPGHLVDHMGGNGSGRPPDSAAVSGRDDRAARFANRVESPREAPPSDPHR